MIKNKNKNLNGKSCTDYTTPKDKSGISVPPEIFTPHFFTYPASDLALKSLDASQIDLTGTDSLINFTNDLLWSVDPGFKLIAANKAFVNGLKDLTGLIFKPGDHLLKKEVFGEDFLVFWETCYKEALTDRSFNKEVYTAAINTCTESWTDTSFNPIYKDGNIIGVACLSRNVTERKIAEQKLQQSEARLIAAQEVAKVGSWETDLLTLEVIWSDETYRIFGIDPADFKTSHPGFLDFVHPDDRFMVDAAFVNSLKDDILNTIEHRILTPGGETRFVEERWRIFCNNQGLAVRAVGTCRDITEHKANEAALKKAYEEKGNILESIDDGFFSTDNNSLVTYWNRKAEILLCKKSEDIIGKNLHEVFSEKGSRNVFYENYQKAIRENTTVHFEEFSERSNKWFAVSAFASQNGLSVHFKDVTQRKVFENKIKDSELRYRSLVEQATDAICIADTSFNILDVNPSCCEMLGYSKEEFLQLTVTDLFLADDLKSSPFKQDDLISGKIIRNERRLKRKDGKVIEIEISAKIIEDGRVIIFGHDISERKSAERAIIESEMKYRSFYENSMDGILISVTDGEILSANPAACAIFRMTEEEICKAGRHGLIDNTDPRVKILIDERRANGKAKGEITYKRKDGSTFPGEISSVIFKDAYGQERTSIIVRDITEQVTSHKKIEASEKQYRRIVETAQEGIWMIDENNKTVFVNRKMCEILEYSEQEMMGRTNLSFKGKKGRITALQQLERRRNGAKETFEDTLITKSGRNIWVQFSTNPILGEDGSYIGALAMITDITEKKQAELSLRESNERYNIISNATNDMVWDWDLVTNKVYRNKEGWKKIFRTGDKEIDNDLINDWDNKVHPEDQAKVKQIEQEILDSEKDFFEVECRMLRDDGTYAYVHDKGYIIRNGQGKAVRLIGATQDITRRKEAELQVLKSEVRFRSLVQNSSELICIFNDRGYFKYSSPAIKQMLGFEPEDTIEKNAFAYIHQDDVAMLKDYLSQMKTAVPHKMPLLRFKNIRGEWRWIESKVTDMSDNPEVAGYVFNCRDVTERKITEEEIEKLSIIARETGNAVIITDADGKIIWVNEGFTSITEFEADEVIGKKPGDFLQGEETSLAVVRFMRNKIKNVEPFECDILNYSKSGRKYWLRIQSQPQFDETGKLKYFFAIETDITKEKEAEAILKTSEERYRYLFNNNPANIFIWDINTFQILEVNDTAIDLYGYDRQEFLTRTVMDISLPEDNDSIRKFVSKARLKSDFRSTVTCEHINKAGEKMFMNISSHRIDFKGRTVILALATDITDKVNLENELENERQLKHQEITEAVISAQEQERQELGSELHDNITQILAGSLLYLGLAAKELETEHPYIKETHTLINTAITEIRNLSHALISPSLNESELLNAIDENIIKITQQASGIHICLQAAGFDETAVPDKLKLNIYRIVQEQFNNILKHAMAKNVIVHLKQDHEKTILSIKDDGVGFDTGKKANGVGLMNIKTRASLFNGEVSIITSPGKGCELRIVFS